MRSMPDNSVDSIVTDPPYEIGFMSKSWDSTGIAFNVEVWTEALRVLKPGGHLLAFSGSRTYHRMAVAIEDAGFQIRDQIMWIYGSGFPKSLNVGKHLEDWQGWGTALKPAHEPLVLARKPFPKGYTVVQNVLEFGVGGVNIDESRIPHLDEADRASATPQGRVTSNTMAGAVPDVDDIGRKELDRPDTSKGRFPANIIHDGSDEVLAGFPITGGGKLTIGGKPRTNIGHKLSETSADRSEAIVNFGDSGSAARFFYCPKTSKKDRNEGLEGFEEKQTAGGGGGIGDYQDDVNSASGKFGSEKAPAKNNHPTVKPTDLMRYLCKLITPPNGIVLDPFMGSGSTGKGAVMEGFNFIGIELDSDYIAIANARIQHQLDNKEDN